MPANRHERCREIDREFAVLMLTWEDQQRRRSQLLARVRRLAGRVSIVDAQGRLRKHQQLPGS
jgi:hypothetical protein